MRDRGAIAQLGERLDRTQEVGGSSPPSSTSKALQTASLLERRVTEPRLVLSAVKTG